MTIELVTLAVVLVVIAVVFAYTMKTGISPVPTSPRVKRAVLKSVPDDMHGTVYELGSGWGTLAIPLAKRFPDRAVVGYEISPLPWAFSRLWQAIAGVPNLSLRRGNFYNVYITDAGLVVCYLFPSAMEALRLKFEAELRLGTVIVSNFVPFAGGKRNRSAPPKTRTPARSTSTGCLVRAAQVAPTARVAPASQAPVSASSCGARVSRTRW